MSGPRAPRRHVVAAVGEIAPGGRKLVTLEGREIGVYFVDGEYFALRHRCPHQGGPLGDGRLLRVVDSRGPGRVRHLRTAQRLLRVPLARRWEFDIRTNGQSWFDPARQRVGRYPVSVEPGAALPAGALERGPYRAETFPVEGRARLRAGSSSTAEAGGQDPRGERLFDRRDDRVLRWGWSSW